ncbi:MAG TPA: hypothetical protein VGZ71_12905 [Puia sp.]|nr:hypothetical protein [Puia sp.]
MFTIKTQQLEIFSKHMASNFFKETRSHIKKNFTLATKNMSDKMIDDIISHGIEKSASYNIVERRNVFKYTEYMFCFGKDFDTDPSTAWASKILRIRNLSEDEKINRLLKTRLPNQ